MTTEIVYCFCCRRPLEYEFSTSPSDEHHIGMLHDGLVCYTTGNYGSFVFDPPSGQVLEFYICDACVAERAHRLTHIKLTTKEGRQYMAQHEPVTYRGPWQDAPTHLADVLDHMDGK